MKIQPTPSSLFRTLICSLLGIFVFSGPVLAQTIVSKPGKIMHYAADLNTSTNWILLEHFYYQYYPTGLVKEILITDSLNQNVRKTTFTYDNIGNETGKINSIWQNNIWTDYYSRNHIIYDANNNILENDEQSLNNGIWESVGKIVYSYTNGIISEIRWQNLNKATNQWMDVKRQTGLSWYKPNKILSGYTTQLNQNSSFWVNSERVSATFGLNGSSETTSEAWVNNAWQNNYKTTITHDSLGNEINYLKEYWNNGNWSFYAQNIQPIVYDPNGNILEQYSTKTCISCTPTGIDKYVYSNYQTFTVAGLKNEIPQEITANIFPNPTQNLLNIELPEKAQAVTSQLSDLTGKVILTRNFKTSETKQLDLANLKPGIYLLTLQTDKGKTVRKIVKN